MIFRMGARLVVPLLLLYGVFLLARGHYEPGGGFSGGLVVASAFAIYLLAFGPKAARRMIRVQPQILIGIGLLVSFASALPSLLLGLQPMAGVWVTIPPGAPDGYDLGTPFVFDIGVFLLVIGMTAALLLTLSEDAQR